MIGLILKTVHWTMFFLNAIALEKKILNEIVQLEKKIFFQLKFLIFQFTREQIKLPTSKFQFFACVQKHPVLFIHLI